MSSAMLAKMYPDPIDAALPRGPDRDEPSGELPVLTDRGRYLLQIENKASSKWTAP